MQLWTLSYSSKYVEHHRANKKEAQEMELVLLSLALTPAPVRCFFHPSEPPRKMYHIMQEMNLNVNNLDFQGYT